MNSPFNVRFEVLTAVLMKIQDLWDVTICRLANTVVTYLHFQGSSTRPLFLDYSEDGQLASS